MRSITPAARSCNPTRKVALVAVTIVAVPAAVAVEMDGALDLVQPFENTIQPNGHHIRQHIVAQIGPVVGRVLGFCA